MGNGFLILNKSLKYSLSIKLKEKLADVYDNLQQQNNRFPVIKMSTVSVTHVMTEQVGLQEYNIVYNAPGIDKLLNATNNKIGNRMLERLFKKYMPRHIFIYSNQEYVLTQY